MASPTPANGTAAATLLKERDKTARAADVIDRDPEEASALLEPYVAKASPDIGDITQADMFRLMAQMQQQMGAMQQQIVDLMLKQGTNPSPKANADTAAELEQARIQRELTMKSWNDEPREPVFVHPDQDEDKIHAVTGMYPPRVFRVNGLEFPIIPGQIASVPSSIARLVEHTQHKRPYQGPPQALQSFPDPQRAQFLAGSPSVTVGRPGRSGEGRLVPDGLPPDPTPLGLRYDANGL